MEAAIRHNTAQMVGPRSIATSNADNLFTNTADERFEVPNYDQSSLSSVQVTGGCSSESY